MKRYRSLKNRKPWKLRAERSGARPSDRAAVREREAQERKDYATVHKRSGGYCEVRLPIDSGRFLWTTGKMLALGERLPVVRCQRSRMPGVHHITKRSQGGKFKGPDYLMDICWFHHDLADNADAAKTSTALDGEIRRGRLRISALGGGKFRCWMETESVKRGVSVSRENTTWPGRNDTTAIGGASEAS